MSEERTNMAIRDLKHYVIDNMSLDVQDDFEIICKYITNLQKKVEQLEKELNQEKEEFAGLHKVLNNKEEEFEKENYNNVVEISRLKRKVEQLENIRKEAIDLINKNSQYPTYYLTGNIVKDLLNILKNGDNKDVKKNNTNSN